MKEFSPDTYYVVGFTGGGCRKHGEVRFRTRRGAMKHLCRLFKSLQTEDMQEFEVFLDRVASRAPNTLSREEWHTNRFFDMTVDVHGRVHEWTGLNWEQVRMLKR